MYIANCPFNKMKIFSEATIGLEKSFPMMYSNIGLNSRETVPLIVILFVYFVAPYELADRWYSDPDRGQQICSEGIRLC